MERRLKSQGCKSHFYQLVLVILKELLKFSASVPPQILTGVNDFCIGTPYALYEEKGSLVYIKMFKSFKSP